MPDDGRDVLAEHVTALLGLLEIMIAPSGSGLDPIERSLLDRALFTTYARAGITADGSSHARPAPLMRDLLTVLEEVEPGRAAGTTSSIAEGIASRLARYVTGSLGAGLFSKPTDVVLDRRLVVFNIQQLEDELRPLAIHLIAGFVWGRVRRERRPRLLVIDEAWSLLRYAEGAAFVSGMARRARKYYLGLITITQDVADCLRSDHGRAVLANSAMKLLLRARLKSNYGTPEVRGLEVEDIVQRLAEQLMPLLDRSNRIMLRNLRALRERRQSSASSVSIGQAGQVKSASVRSTPCSPESRMSWRRLTDSVEAGGRAGLDTVRRLQMRSGAADGSATGSSNSHGHRWGVTRGNCPPRGRSWLSRTCSASAYMPSALKSTAPMTWSSWWA